jgi:ABC-type oligopeptide transport system substrate-binding subunit
MKINVKSMLLIFVVLTVLLSGCGAAAAPATQAPPATQIPLPTATAQPSNTPIPTIAPVPTSTPEPTALPGKVIFPLSSLQYGMPWLPMDNTKIPTVVYYGFNVKKPPFNVPEVRQAFMAALDTEVLTLIYEKGTFITNAKSTRTIIPPETLSRDVSGEIGIPYDPALAKQLLAKVGYTDPASFPEISLLVVYISSSSYPGLIVAAAQEAARMWKTNLGVTVKLVVKGVAKLPTDQLDLIHSGQYDMFEEGVWANQNDPDSFVNSMFSPNGSNNLTGFEDARITKLIADGEQAVDPAERLPIYLEIERILSEQDLPIIPIYHGTVNFGG